MYAKFFLWNVKKNFQSSWQTKKNQLEFQQEFGTRSEEARLLRIARDDTMESHCERAARARQSNMSSVQTRLIASLALAMTWKKLLFCHSEAACGWRISKHKNPKGLFRFASTWQDSMCHCERATRAWQSTSKESQASIQRLLIVSASPRNDKNKCLFLSFWTRSVKNLIMQESWDVSLTLNMTRFHVSLRASNASAAINRIGILFWDSLLVDCFANVRNDR